MRLRRGEFRGLRGVRLWRQASRTVNLVLAHDKKSGIFQLESSGLWEPERIDRLLLVVAIAVLAGSLQGYPLSLAGLHRHVDPHWQRSLSFLCIGVATLQRVAADTGASLTAWLPIPIRELGRCFPSRKARPKQAQPLFSKVELPPQSGLQHRPELAVS